VIEICIKDRKKENRSFGRRFGLQWHITHKCDQRCKHCYIWRGGNKHNREISLKECNSIIKQFLEFCNIFKVDPSINITGGDPLLSQHFWRIIEYISEQRKKCKNIRFMILGNPFHLNKKKCEKLKSLGCASYQLSLDGLESTHDFLRKRGSFKATLDAIDILQESNIKTVVMSTVSRFNYKEIPALFELMISKRVEVYSFARYCPTSLQDIDLLLKPNEYRIFLSTMWLLREKYKQCGTKFTLKDHLWKLWLYENGLLKIYKEDVVFSGCNCGIRHLTLLPDGTVYACRRFDSPIGNILLQSFKEIFLGEELNKYRKINEIEKCNKCDLLNYCRGCRAMSYSVYNNFFARDPQCWR